MRKSKIFISLLSVVLSSILMFSIFSSEIFRIDAAADVKLNGVSGRISEIKDDFLNIFNDDSINKEEKNIASQLLPYVYVGGYPIGLKLYADGVVIVGTEAVDTENGPVNTAQKAGLKLGDIIKKVNGTKVNNNSQVSEIIEKSAGETLIFEAERDDKVFTVSFKAEYSVSEGKYKAGIWIRDSSAGIGTVTFCTEDGFFASLGHAVCDIDTKSTIPISQGECTEAKITGYIKGENGTAGELCGYLDSNKTGIVYSNDDLGVYGLFNSVPQGFEKLQIASKDEVEAGEAEILTTVENGLIERYSIVIDKIDENSTDNKNLVIRVTDRALIEKTGGIIQGMSGSPIIQNGKLVGAVTHVFLNDPTGGFGIFAQTMLEKVNNIKE